ncbi:hypothetical protein [Polynucleobacter sp. AP-Reno-20A-A9]|uniref:hypothetical protein n=1 Tax=Polynucleobacter sp. AP-Reno-20A-A9 TaxID=2576925 RepID=UPI001C0D8FAE|nr:hypothetical protein [Polynucleobacter sp. AP-Reno-20A-A9]MBU3629374.1 hypothetical protein [Polynucleobacter sp. AP-Reno-20A-A9]
MFKEKLIIFFRRTSEAVPACLFAMVQGNLVIITWAHWVIALRTGAAAGFVMVVMSYVEPKTWLHNKYTTGALTGIATALSDYFVHPAGFTGEAIATGFAAAILCVLYSFVVKN